MFRVFPKLWAKICRRVPTNICPKNAWSVRHFVFFFYKKTNFRTYIIYRVQIWYAYFVCDILFVPKTRTFTCFQNGGGFTFLMSNIKKKLRPIESVSHKLMNWILFSINYKNISNAGIFKTCRTKLSFFLSYNKYVYRIRAVHLIYFQ